MVGPLIANCGSLDSTLPDDLEPDRCQDWIDGGVDGTALGGRQQELGHPGKMQTSVSGLISEKLEPSPDNGGQEMIWARFITSREAMLSAVMLSRTLESPIMVNKRDTDIFRSGRLVFHRKIIISENGNSCKELVRANWRQWLVESLNTECPKNVK